MGFGALTALAMSVGAAVVVAAFGPTNPFQLVRPIGHLTRTGVVGQPLQRQRHGIARAVAREPAGEWAVVRRDPKGPSQTVS